MNKINYALISALYDTKGADLYNDVYFPIIKYEIVNQYYTQNVIEKHYDLDELQQLIISNFGVKIPLIILRQSINAIGRSDNSISLSVYEKGKHFKIKKAWDISINVSIDNKSLQISSKFGHLESLYKRYLELENLPYEKSLIDFYSDNTEEIFQYLDEANGNSKINERYVNLARFLTWLKNNNLDLFNIANDIFWGSIIAGFLIRNKADINIKSTEKVEYYLDSSLILAILDLDNKDNVNYSQELLDIIKSSGNTPMVHALTIREINNILNSVEREQGPRPNTSIEEAYYRLKLTPSKVLKLRNQLTQLITEQGINIFPVPDNELDRIENEYKNKQIVKELEKLRSSNYNNSLRDIHDIYLKDFIQKKHKNIASIEKLKSYFVTLNSELISFFNPESTNKAVPFVIHPSKIVIDLWIHNSSSSFVKNNGLTELMSRCFALNNNDIRRKLSLVKKYYRVSDNDYSEDNYKMVYSALIKRSTKALQELEYISINENEGIENKEIINKNHIQILIKVAIDEELKNKESSATLNNELEKLKEAVDATNAQISSYKSNKDNDEETINKLKEEIEIQKKITTLTEQINETTNKIADLEKNKSKSISNVKYYLIISIERIAVIGLLLFLILLIYFNWDINEFSFKGFIIQNLKLLIGFFVTLIGLISRIQNLYILSPKLQYEENRTKQINYWINLNPQYNELKELFKDLQNSRNSLIKNN